VTGYWLNRAFNDLNTPECREALRAGASVYTLTKLGAATGVSLLAMGAQMRGQSVDEFFAFLAEQNEAGTAYQLVPSAQPVPGRGGEDG